MKRLTTLLSGLLCTTMMVMAVPAKPGIMRLTQPDGSVVEATIVGDEHFHYYETPAGEILLRDNTGTLRPATISADGSLEACGAITGKATPAAERTLIFKAIAEQAEKAAGKQPSRVAPNPILPKFPTTGTVTGLILLVEYQDVKLTPQATLEHYEQICNQAGYQSEATHGSVLDYFTSQSNGRFTPRFDVFGPLTLPRERAYYGMADNGLVNQFRDACLVADEMGLDFSKYDINEDGFVDFLFIVFAGHGEAQGGPYESVWPAMMDLSDYVFDYFDGLNLGVAACSCELKGGSGTNLDGVGTICHEFSHILGLADIYDTSKQGGHGMCHYDIMDIGTYNDNQVTPSGYTAMDKYTLGWLEPMVLDSPIENVTLRPFNETHDAAFIVNPDNPDEYYTLENRQQQGWDKGIPGHGLVATYCHYDKKLWNRNIVNAVAAGYEHVCIVAADNVWMNSVSDEAGDPFPGTMQNTALSATTVPAAFWKSSGSAVPVPWYISNIRETAEGNITFDFSTTAGVNAIADDDPCVRVEGNSIIAPEGSEIYDIAGRRTSAQYLPEGIYIVATPQGAVKVKI
jgi:M6 family metalloprotease-like protein